MPSCTAEVCSTRSKPFSRTMCSDIKPSAVTAMLERCVACMSIHTPKVCMNMCSNMYYTCWVWIGWKMSGSTTLNLLSSSNKCCGQLCCSCAGGEHHCARQATCPLGGLPGTFGSHTYTMCTISPCTRFCLPGCVIPTLKGLSSA